MSASMIVTGVKDTDKQKNKTTLIRFLEYSRQLHNSDASVVLVQPIVWVITVSYSSGSASHHPDSPLDNMYSLTPSILPF